MFIILNLFFETQRAEQDRNIKETNISVKHIDILQKKSHWLHSTGKKWSRKLISRNFFKLSRNDEKNVTVSVWQKSFEDESVRRP